jgi:hypothetical protein
LIGLALGFAVPAACDRALLGLSEPWTPGPPRVWVADRDAGRLVALDGELYVRAHAELAAPVAVGACRDGGAWALDLVERRPGGALALVRVEAGGRTTFTRELVPPGRPRRVEPADLFVSDGRDAVVCVVDDARASRVLRVSAGGRSAPELFVPGARAAAGRGSRVRVGGADGALRVFDRAFDDALVALGGLAAPVLDVAPAPRDAWWVLTGAEEPGQRTLWLVAGVDLAPRWRTAVAEEARSLAAIPAREAVWIVSTASAQVRSYAAWRGSGPAARGLPLGGFGAAAGRADGGLYVPAPGALLELDSAGRIVRSQGGFDFLVAAACVPR